ncbi:MAG: hypothetical protein A2805_01805 [Candidatus Andersenbacteria bacterium RIFCSPHIGHO2_01_FULL_46_36]|nr:MAG: hypothetical protein A2805_01805 [Candidatus Andersenbacteria bacterium RIFCSPHIGHO2_01_FULL_46_36]QBM02235.1 hypothetical protein [uncultured archaeon]
MLVDRILEYYGHNLDAYPIIEDRWMVAFNDIFNSYYLLLPFIFALLPWIYFLWKKEAHKKDGKIFRRKIIIASIIGLVFGLLAPYLILAIAASLAARDLYG